ncbi:MAG: type II toxin-antitoxin system prevent-host-death family antitoxin [Rickettsiales bacterium]|nr:type II toxin-antitoxin system prevent-host-death family antitoxin [Rickettsiales bacterium]
MQIVSFTVARNNLKALLDSVLNNFEPTAITRRNGEAVVLVPLSEWNRWSETEHLKASGNNHKKLLNSISDHKKGKIFKKKLIDE